MLSVEGFYDGQCVKLKENVEVEKNQRVIVIFAEEFLNNRDEDNEIEDDEFLEALKTDKYVSKETTNYDVDAFIRESRGYE